MAKYKRQVPYDKPAFTEQEPDTKSLASFCNHGLEIEEQMKVTLGCILYDAKTADFSSMKTSVFEKPYTEV